jgi:multidrug resistance efflux pump
VISVAAEPGQVVAAGQPVLKLARAGEKEVVLNAPEGQLARFKPGQEVGISLWAAPTSSSRDACVKSRAAPTRSREPMRCASRRSIRRPMRSSV